MNRINTCIYTVGEPEKSGLSQIYALAEASGIEVSEAFHDEEGCICAFRRLQDCVKLGLCQRLLLYDVGALGTDRWLRLENELFMRRNGVKLRFVIKPERDRRYRLADAVKLYHSPCHTWAVEHGDELPLPPMRAGRRRLPFGYKNENGVAAIDEPQAEKVKKLFDDYAHGLGFAQMLERFNEGDGGADIGFINDILCGRRYLGAALDSGYRLPGIISFASWYAAQSRRMKKRPDRFEAAESAPYFVPSSVGARVRYYRGETPARSGAALNVDSDKLERVFEREIAAVARDAAEGFYSGCVLAMRDDAEAALPEAREAADSAEAALSSLHERLMHGERGEALQNELMNALDACHTAGFRLRRVETELRLFSVTPEEVRTFFARACMPAVCTREERRFFASVFILKAAVSERGLILKLASPSSDKPVSRPIPINELK